MFPPFLQRAERERAGQPGGRQRGIEGSTLGLPSGILTWRFSRWAVSAPLGTSVQSPPNSSCLPTAPRMNPKLLTMALRNPSRRPHLLPSLPLARGPPATLAPAFSPSSFASGPLYWLLLPGTLFPRPSHCCLLLEFGALAEMSLFRAVSPTIQPHAMKMPYRHLHSPHHRPNVSYIFVHMFTCLSSVCAALPSPPLPSL